MSAGRIVQIFKDAYKRGAQRDAKREQATAIQRTCSFNEPVRAQFVRFFSSFLTKRSDSRGKIKRGA